MSSLSYRCSKFKKFCYNSEEKTFLGRTGKSWGLSLENATKPGFVELGLPLLPDAAAFVDKHFVCDSNEELCKQLKECKFCAYLKINTIVQWYPDVETGSGIQIKCEPKNKVDEETIGSISYIGANSSSVYGIISTAPFPYTGKDGGFKNPLLGVNFDKLKKGTMATVKCRFENLKNAYPDFELEFGVELKA